MKFRTDRASLLAALKALKPIARGNAKPVLNAVRLGVGQSNAVTVEATNLEVEHTIELRADDVIFGAALVDCAMLIDALDCADAALVTVERDPTAEKNEVTVQADACKLTVEALDPDEFPGKQRFDSGAKSFGADADELRDALRFVDVAASRDTTRYELNGVYFQADGDGFKLTATDGKRLTHARLDGDASPDAASWILPNIGTDALLRVLKGDGVRITVDETKSRFETADQTVIVKNVEGIYPNYASVFPKSTPIRAAFDNADLLKIFNGAKKAVYKDTAMVILSTGEGRMRIEAQGRFRAEWTADAETVDSIEMRFNPFHFLEALKAFDKRDRITLEANEPGRPARLTANEGRFYHYVMPLVIG